MVWAEGFFFFWAVKTETEMTKQNVLVSEAQSAINMAITVAVSNSSIFTTAAQKPQAAAGGYISISTKKLLKNLEINNGGTRTNGWIDSMRASSPTHIKSTPSLTDEQSSWIVSTKNFQYFFSLNLFKTEITSCFCYVFYFPGFLIFFNNDESDFCFFFWNI